MNIIRHGFPIIDIFAAILPCSYATPTVDARDDGYEQPIQKFICPNTKMEFEAKTISITTMSVNTFESHSLYALNAYADENPKKISKYLQHIYPEIYKTQQLRYVVYRLHNIKPHDFILADHDKN